MTFSFVITNYNYGKYIAQAVRSIVHLDKEADWTFDLLVGDDASTDGSLQEIYKILNENENKFRSIHRVFNQENRGKNNLLNHLIRKIETEYTVILDADDWLYQEFLTSSLRHLQENRSVNPRIGFVYSDCILCNEKGEPLGKGQSTAFSRDLLLTHSYIPQTCLVRTEVLRTCLPLDETIRVGTKHHQWKKMCAGGWEGKHISKPLFYYRMHDRNISEIGRKVLVDEQSDVKDRILYGYWPSERKAS